MWWAGHVARMGEERGMYRVLVGKPEGKRPVGRPRRRWVDNIRTDLQDVRCGYMDWIGLAQDRDSWRTLVSAAMNLRVPWNAQNFLTSCKPVSFSRRTLHHGVSKYVSDQATEEALTDSARTRVSLFSKASWLTLRRTQPPTDWALGCVIRSTAVEAWRWPLTSNYGQNTEWVGKCLHFRISLMACAQSILASHLSYTSRGNWI